MLNESSGQAPSVSAAEVEHLRRDSLCPSERADAISYDWAHIGFGIVLAGGAYPLVLAAISIVVGAIVYSWSLIVGDQYAPDLTEAVSTVFAVGMYAFLGGMVGMLWSGLVTVLTLPIVGLIAWSLELRASIVRVGAFAGGLVGFICVLPLALRVPWFAFNGEFWEGVIFLLVGPVATTVLGQLGGAWGGGKSRQAGSSTSRQKPILVTDYFDPPAVDESQGAETTPPRFQFRIRHLLWISLWFSLLLTLIRLCGIPYELFLPLLLGWLLFQSATLWMGGLLIPRLASWRERRRQFRST